VKLKMVQLQFLDQAERAI